MPIEFDSEVVRLVVEEESLRVEAVYNFLCHPTEAPIMPLFYPYPADSLMGGARTVALQCRAPGMAWEPMEFIELPGGEGARWIVPLNRGDTLQIRAVYRQALRASYARYIVTTTKAWGRPLSYARFEIYLPNDAEPAEHSFPIKPQLLQGQRVYVYEASDFMPEQDLTVTWLPRADIPEEQ